MLLPSHREIIGAFVFKAFRYDGLSNFKPIVGSAMVRELKKYIRHTNAAAAAQNILFVVFFSLQILVRSHRTAVYYQVMTADEELHSIPVCAYNAPHDFAATTTEQRALSQFAN